MSGTLDDWIEACRASPGVLPASVEPVQARLVRSVGRGVLDDGRVAFVKVMAFPRFRDRLRYVHRALPGSHEAEMLGRARELGVRCPPVLRVHTERRLGVPRLSVLVTEALPDERPAEFGAAARVAARLADGGLFHPDLNRGNFLVDAAGDHAVLDLQSARWIGSSLDAQRRRRMATKLALEFDGFDRVEELVAAGLVSAADAGRVRAGVDELRAADSRRRLLRCLANSTEFEVVRRWGGRVHRHRGVDLDDAGRWVEHPDAERLWIGDRALFLLDQEPPRLAAMFRRAWWLPGQSSVYISAADEPSLSPALAVRLLDGYSRVRGCLSGESGADSGERPGS